MNYLLALLFLLPTSKTTIDNKDVYYQIKDENHLIIKNKLNNSIYQLIIYESNIIKISPFGEYILIYLENGKIYAYRQECNNFAIFNNREELLNSYINNEIEDLL